MITTQACRARARTRRTSSGFTLMELMIAVAVVAILASIAYPSYNAYIARARRADAKAMLLDAAAWMERMVPINNNSYPTTSAALTSAGYGASPNSGRAYYIIDFAAPPAAPTATSFTLTATVNSAVWSEPLCASLSINEQGTRTATGTDSANCWSK